MRSTTDDICLFKGHRKLKEKKNLEFQIPIEEKKNWKKNGKTKRY